MENEYDFILENLIPSYSMVNSFNTCKLCFKLSYIDGKTKIGNAFGEFGSFIHECLEKYFKKELEIWDLPKYYEDNYYGSVVTPFPPYPKGMDEMYYQDGLDFLYNLDFNLEEYDVIIVEDFIQYDYLGTQIVVKPDVVVKNKNTGKTILIDFKTSKLKNTKADDKKIEEYMNQMHIYSYFLYLERNIEIDQIDIWFIRNGLIKNFILDKNSMMSSIQWFEESIDNIKKNTSWEANATKANKYFCDNICSVRMSCGARMLS